MSEVLLGQCSHEVSPEMAEVSTLAQFGFGRLGGRDARGVFVAKFDEAAVVQEADDHSFSNGLQQRAPEAMMSLAQGIFAVETIVDGSPCTRVEWQIDDFCSKLQATMNRHLVSPGLPLNQTELVLESGVVLLSRKPISGVTVFFDSFLEQNMEYLASLVYTSILQA
eukprot:6479542-Amphidinium_carterae.1